MKRILALMFLMLLSAACGVGDEPVVATTLRPTEPGAAATLTIPADLDSPSADKWALWTGDTHLRGVDMHPCSFYDGSPECVESLTREDVQAARDLGANLINASYAGVFTEQPPYEVDPLTLQQLDDLLTWAQEAGMYVVIHFRSGPGRNNAAIANTDDALYTVWTDQAAHGGWAAMWRFTAERYRDNPAVVGYDLMVEPHPNTLIDLDGSLSMEETQAQMAGTLLSP